MAKITHEKLVEIYKSTGWEIVDIYPAPEITVMRKGEHINNSVQWKFKSIINSKAHDGAWNPKWESKTDCNFIGTTGNCDDIGKECQFLNMGQKIKEDRKEEEATLREIAILLSGQLNRISQNSILCWGNYDLIEALKSLKRELKGFNMHNERWRD